MTKVLLDLADAALAVKDLKAQPKVRHALPPFTTSTLQQAASSVLGFSPGKTMKLAQSLYEQGRITYMRTDSVNVSDQARAAAKEFIVSACGSEYYPASPNFFKSKADAQGAHEAIRPTDVGLVPKSSKLEPQELKLYDLIWKRTLASQMSEAKVLNTGNGTYEEVINYANLAEVGTSLEENFADIYGTRTGKEIIWAIYYGYPETSGDNYSHFMTLRDVFVEKAVNKDDVPYAKSGARSRYNPSPKIREIFNRYQGDVRLANAFIDAVDEKGNVLGTSQVKMRGTKTETNVIFDNDIVLYRHAEMIMFKAEAYAAMGQVSNAIAELDKIRKRAGIGAYAGSTEQKKVELEILEERAREFFLENKRWPDLLRFHYEGLIDVYQVVPKLKERYDLGTIVPLYLSIPISEITLNDKLEQTEGYELDLDE